MQQRFKKVRTSWMEELVASLSSNPILACDFSPNFKSYKIDSFTFQVKGSIRTLSPPQLSIDIAQQTVHKLNEKAIRTRKTYQANLITDSLDNQITSIEELPPQAIDGEDEYHDENGFFKIGLAIVKQEGVKKTKQRIERELRHCSERSGARFTNLQQRNDSSDLCYLLLSLVVRMFLAVQQKQKKLKIARLLYYPKVDIQIQKIKIYPFSFIMNQTLKKVQQHNNQKQALYGYVSLSRSEKDTFMFCTFSVQEFEKVSKSNFPVIGIFIAGKLGGQLKQESLLWSLIMEYLSNPLLNNRRLCLNGPRTGLLFHFYQKGKNTSYQFEVPISAKWKLSTSVQTFASFPKEIVFSTRQIIMEEDRQESEVESVQSKQAYPTADGPPDTYSSRSFDEKDVEIARLKAELEKYKNQNEWLKQLVANLTSNQSTSKSTLAANQYPVNNAYNPNQAYQSTYSQPYFSSYESQTQVTKQPVRGQKQFKIRDSKNISFAQQNSYQQENQMDTFLQEEWFSSPQFNMKETINSKQEVKAFQFLQQEQQPDFQQEKKATLQNITQHKTNKIKSYQDCKYQLRNPTSPTKYTEHPIQKQQNTQTPRNQPAHSKETTSPNTVQKIETHSQRNKALGSITPRQHIEITKKYLDQEINQENQKKEVPKKPVQPMKRQEQTTARSSKKIVLSSQSDDEEVNKIIAERNRRK